MKFISAVLLCAAVSGCTVGGTSSTREERCAEMRVEGLPKSQAFERAGFLVWGWLGRTEQRPEIVLVDLETMMDTWEVSGASCQGVAYVGVGGSNQPSATSISHELLHHALWYDGDPDATHASPEWLDLPRYLNQRLWEVGL